MNMDFSFLYICSCNNVITIIADTFLPFIEIFYSNGFNLFECVSIFTLLSATALSSRLCIEITYAEQLLMFSAPNMLSTLKLRVSTISSL